MGKHHVLPGFRKNPKIPDLPGSCGVLVSPGIKSELSSHQMSVRESSGAHQESAKSQQRRAPGVVRVVSKDEPRSRGVGTLVRRYH